MTLRVRTAVCLLGAAGVAVLLALAFFKMPSFGGDWHPYRDLVRPIGALHATPNLISSVNFDIRALDTLGEESIVAASVVGVLSLLQPSKEERKSIEPAERPVASAVKLAGYLMLPVTVLLGLDVVLHGHLTPGGGFQGGVVLVTGWHLLYISGSYPALARLRPIDWCEYAEAAGIGLYAVTGILGLGLGTEFLANFLPTGQAGALISAGIVPVLSILVGIAVAGGFLVLLAQFLEQSLIREGSDS
ncbi:MAG TPA: MnhB domain-containing protein [Amycolatopsis sp.]|nr:MnhB domain-containing protein [Amycolatopsis sp.]